MSSLFEAHRRASPAQSGVPDAHRCAWVSDMLGGERCHNPGAMSHGTRGDGPWYCAGHFTCSDGAEGAEIVSMSIGHRAGAEVRFPARDKRLQEAAEQVLVQAEPGSGG